MYADGDAEEIFDNHPNAEVEEFFSSKIRKQAEPENLATDNDLGTNEKVKIIRGGNLPSANSFPGCSSHL